MVIAKKLFEGLSIILKYYPEAHIWYCDHDEFCINGGQNGFEVTEFDMNIFSEQEKERLDELGFMLPDSDGFYHRETIGLFQ